MTMRTKNLAILIVILVIGGLAALLATIYFEVSPDNLQACTEEAKLCPDGSYVARTGPNCEFAPCPDVAGEEDEHEVPPGLSYEEFQFELQEAVRIEIGQPIEGYEPQMFMQVFPGLMSSDFDGVDAQIGVYKYEEGKLVHDLGDVELIHSAAPAITEAGFKTLLDNTQQRLRVVSGTPIEEVILQLKGGNLDKHDYPVACTMDAKACPDGSFVGRIGPDCEFEACPGESSTVDSFEDCVAAGNPIMESYPRQCNHEGEHFVEQIDPPISEFPIRYGEDVSKMEEYRSDCEQRMGTFNECGSACGPEADACMTVCSMICEGPASEHMPPVPPDSNFCSPASRGVDACIEIYQPVCGQVEVQCITTPCNPVPETFSNSCFACMNENVVSYTEGACEIELAS